MASDDLWKSGARCLALCARRCSTNAQKPRHQANAGVLYLFRNLQKGWKIAMQRDKTPLVRLLQLAYSGELGAALAYRGHAASVRDPAERQHILQIRAEELDHRARVGRILGLVGGRPDPLLELRNRCVGRGIAIFCHVGGWFAPMYGAGWIERLNIREYERAARLATLHGSADFADELLDLAEVEWEHERYFRLKAASHRFARLLHVWPAPPPKAEIRRSYAQFTRGLLQASHGPLTPHGSVLVRSS
jgi:rubrerythrin